MSKAILTTEPTSNVAPLLLKPVDAARALAISPRALWTLMNTGTIPCVRLGRATRYDPDDLRRFIASQKKA